ncbi:hypothetical protein PENVUL_c032G06528 [Penicillium vulpinum]|uniref:AMP-dependent synthetase/ligase domain-containing protein n=2 Tax=Penicillium vulpinum TaxID=29845 RepID=A0A1V6RRT2_9EURO|nr:hypothetical protein PENVUL_c032G06528 [Penicillium vulpinum]
MIGALGAVLFPAYMGSYVAAMRNFTLPSYIKACAKVKATTLKVVPSVAVAFAQHPLVKELDLSSIKYILSAGATLQPEVVRKMQELLKGVCFVQTYGMSETIICKLPHNKSIEKVGSVSRLLSGVKIRIVDEKLQDVEPGTPGEVLTKAPTVFMGYRNNTEATNESFHNDWLRTGDVLSMDADGFLWFHERQKELIKVQDNQVAPSELEGIFSAHPKVLEAAVCGYFDESRQTDWPIGYVTLIASVPENERQALLDEIHAWFEGQVATYKKLRGGLHHIDELPRNPTGKLMRGQLPIKLVAKRENKM